MNGRLGQLAVAFLLTATGAIKGARITIRAALRGCPCGTCPS